MARSPSDPEASTSGLETAPSYIRPWASLAYPQFRLLVGSMTFGHLGFQMRQVTNLWLVYELSRSTIQVGLLGLFQLVPLVVLGLLGGALADVWDRKKLLLFSQIANLALALVLATLALTGVVEVWHIYLVTLGTSTVNVVDMPARMSLMPGLVPRSHLMNAITLNSTGRHASMLFGPAMAGAVIAWRGPEAAYLANAALFVPVIAGLLWFRPPPRAVPASGLEGLSWGQLFEGLRFIWSTHFILALITLDVVATVLTSYRALMPVFAKDVLFVDARGLGLLLSAPAFGFLVGAAVLLLIGDTSRKGLLVMGSIVGYAAALVVFATSRSFLLSLIAIAAVGGLDGIGTILRQTVLQLLVPDEIRGRASAVLGMFARGSPSLGYMVTGSMAAALGAAGALIVGSALTVGAVLVIGLAWREVVTLRR